MHTQFISFLLTTYNRVLLQRTSLSNRKKLLTLLPYHPGLRLPADLFETRPQMTTFLPLLAKNTPAKYSPKLLHCRHPQKNQAHRMFHY